MKQGVTPGRDRGCDRALCKESQAAHKSIIQLPGLAYSSKGINEPTHLHLHPIAFTDSRFMLSNMGRVKNLIKKIVRNFKKK